MEKVEGRVNKADPRHQGRVNKAQKVLWLAAVLEGIGRVKGSSSEIQGWSGGALAPTSLSFGEDGFWWVRADLVQALLLGAVLIGFVMGALVFQAFCRFAGGSQAMPDDEGSPCRQDRRRNVSVQAPCSYTWWRQQGRFQPLREREHGCWPE